MGAAAYDYDNSSSKRLLPKDALGQHFVKYFQHGWKFIQAPVPKYGERPSWHTESRYPLELRTLWSKYQNPDLLLGLRFGSYTNYFLLDIDKNSKNHPEKKNGRFDGIGLALEDIGLCRNIQISSSESGGLHIYYFLPYPVHSLSLAVAVKHALIRAGYELKQGELELFPNPKPYNKLEPTSFNAHRLPLQANSFVLDWDLHPISDDINLFLDWADSSANSQDMEELGEAMLLAREWLKEQEYFGSKKSAAQFCSELEEQIEEGWTGFHQTNNLLLAIAKYGIIFLHHLGKDLERFMLEKAISLPGYRQYCRHQHEIEKRVKQWAKSAQNYPYTPFPSSPLRQNSYKDHFFGAEEENNKVVQLHPSKERHAQTMERIRAVIAMLKGEGTFPDTVYKRTQAIIKKSKAAFGVGVSQTTLHKKEYLPLWHPAHEKEEGVNADSTVEKYPILPDPWEGVEEQLKPLEQEVSVDLQVLPPYEGLCLPPAKSVDGGGESVEFEEGQPQDASENGVADMLGEVIPSFYEEQKPQAVSDSVEISLEIQNPGIIFLNGIIPEISSIREIINSESTKSLIEQIQLEYDFEQFIDNQNLSITGGGVSPNFDKLNLSITETVSSPNNSKPFVASESASETIPKASERFGNENYPNNSVAPVSTSETSEVVEHFINSPECSTTAEHFADNLNFSNEALTPLDYRNAIHFEFKAQKKAREYLQEFCTRYSNPSLMPRQRQDYENFIKYNLMLKSCHIPAKQKAHDWLTANKEIVTNARELGLWDFSQNLPVPDF